MKKVFMVLLLMAFCAPALAAYQGPQAQKAGTVREVLTAPDDTYMCLEGQLINQLTNEKYTFQDATGSITAEIKPKYMGATNVTATNRVRICGKVDKEYVKNNEFDVKSIEIIK